MRWLGVAFVVALVLTVPVAYLSIPHIQHWRLIHRLGSTDPDTRAVALRDLSTLVADDTKLLASVMKRLDDMDRQTFMQVVDALQTAGRWTRDFVPDIAWLRWISILADSPGIEAPSYAVQLLAESPDLAGNWHYQASFLMLAEHNEPDVRYNALCAAAELAGSGKVPYAIDLVKRLTRDDNPVVAYHAGLFAYLLKIPGSGPPDWVNKLPAVSHDQPFSLEQIQNLLSSVQAPLRDVGCVLAVRYLTKDQLAGLIQELLTSEDTNQVFSGAILSGMTGLSRDTLQQVLLSQDDWSKMAVIRLGRWLQGPVSEPDFRPAALLARPDIPRSTVILALLHAGDPLAWEALLNPKGEAPDDLLTLLTDFGWWRVLNTYLPEDAPRWHPTDDPVLQQHQIDLL
ncbi:MAG: hypothetical protein D6698_17505, partial [Gammaproteobacteria bacterium]